MIMKLPTFLELKNNTVQSGNCLLWQGAKTQGGHGCIGRHIDGKPKSFIVTRLVLAEKLGRELNKDEQALHTRECNNASCINPEHLYAGTRSENKQDELHTTGYNNPNHQRSFRQFLKRHDYR